MEAVVKVESTAVLHKVYFSHFMLPSAPIRQFRFCCLLFRCLFYLEGLPDKSDESRVSNQV